MLVQGQGAHASASAARWRAERVEQLAGAVLALGGVVEAVEERALLGEEETGAGFGGEELDGGQRDRHQAVVDEQVVGEDDPLVGDDVVVAAPEGVDGAARRTAAVHLAAADPEVELPDPVLDSSRGRRTRRRFNSGSAKALKVCDGVQSY